MHDDKTEADAHMVVEANDEGSPSEAASERHQPNLLEAIEELTEKFQMMLHLSSAQVRTARCSAQCGLLAIQKAQHTPYAHVDFIQQEGEMIRVAREKGLGRKYP